MSLSLMGVKGFKLIIQFIILNGVKHWRTQHVDLFNLNLTPLYCQRDTLKAKKKKFKLSARF